MSNRNVLSKIIDTGGKKTKYPVKNPKEEKKKDGIVIVSLLQLIWFTQKASMNKPYYLKKRKKLVFLT